MTDRYVLRNGIPVPEPDLMKWAEWIESRPDERIVARTERGGVAVSTVFLGLDYRFGDGPPLLYETMVFGGDHDGSFQRYTSRVEAAAGHEQTVQLCFPDPS